MLSSIKFYVYTLSSHRINVFSSVISAGNYNSDVPIFVGWWVDT